MYPISGDGDGDGDGAGAVGRRPGREIVLRTADTPATIALARELMAEYAALPHIAGRWTGIGDELAALPSPYTAPHGAMLLATDGDRAVGCGALRALEPGVIGELKRIYVRPEARGRGVGEVITRTLLTYAAAAGYSAVRLDTAPELLAAQALYRRLGFVVIPPYHEEMSADVICFELQLRPG